MPENNTDYWAIGMRYPSHPFGKLKGLRVIATRLTLRQLLFQCHMSRCSEPRDLIYSLLDIAKDTRDNPGSIVVDYTCSLESLFLQSMICCGLAEYDGIPCLQLCDTLSTRLGVDLVRGFECTVNFLPSDSKSAMVEKLILRSYFAKLIRFGRVVSPTPAEHANSLRHSATFQTEIEIQHPLAQHTVREMPGKKSLH
jgi:hypothetical protein